MLHNYLLLEILVCPESSSLLYDVICQLEKGHTAMLKRCTTPPSVKEGIFLSVT